MILFYDSENDLFMAIKAKDNLIDIKEAMKEAIIWTMKNGTEPCDIYSIPDAILERFGLQRASVDTEYMDNMVLVKNAAQKAGCHFATCAECSAYEYGSCCHYGGRAKGNTTGMDCFHGLYNTYSLVYDGEYISSYIIIDNEDLTAKEVMELLKIELPEKYQNEEFDEKILTLERKEN